MHTCVRACVHVCACACVNVHVLVRADVCLCRVASPEIKKRVRTCGKHAAITLLCENVANTIRSTRQCVTWVGHSASADLSVRSSQCVSELPSPEAFITRPDGRQLATRSVLCMQPTQNAHAHALCMRMRTRQCTRTHRHTHTHTHTCRCTCACAHAARACAAHAQVHARAQTHAHMRTRHTAAHNSAR